MFITKEELADELDSEYIMYCRGAITAKTIVACHTNMFKEVDEFKVRKFGYWWLRYKYGLCTYYQDIKIHTRLTKAVNKALIKTVQQGYTKEALVKNLIKVFIEFSYFYDLIYDRHTEEQQRYLKEKAKYEANNKSKDYTNAICVFFTTLICLIIVFFYVR